MCYTYQVDRSAFAMKRCTHRTDHLRFFPPHDLDLSGKVLSPDLYDLAAHAAGWEPNNLRDLGRVFCGLDLHRADPAQRIINNSCRLGLDGLGRDLSDVRDDASKHTINHRITGPQ